MVYELLGYNTECRDIEDVRYRSYTTSKKKAELFNKIPKIQFTDSGHGIVFDATEFKGTRKQNIYMLYDYVRRQMNE